MDWLKAVRSVIYAILVLAFFVMAVVGLFWLVLLGITGSFFVQLIFGVAVVAVLVAAVAKFIYDEILD